MPKDIEVCTKYFMLFSLISGQCLWVWLSNSSDFVWRRAPLQLSFASSHGAYAVVKLSLIKSAAKNSEDVLDRERYAWKNEKRVRPLGPTSYRILLIPVRQSAGYDRVWRCAISCIVQLLKCCTRRHTIRLCCHIFQVWIFVFRRLDLYVSPFD